jgi:hypothetical protein
MQKFMIEFSPGKLYFPAMMGTFALSLLNPVTRLYQKLRHNPQ